MDDDQHGQPDGYGLGLAREGLGLGYLSNTTRGAVTFQVSAALSVTEALTIAASYKTMARAPVFGWTEAITIAGSTVTHGSPTFEVDLAGPFGPTTTGSSFDVAVSYLASPTGQTSAVVYLFVGGTYTNSDGVFSLVLGVGWDGTPAGWTITQDWTDFGDVISNGFQSILTRATLGTGSAIGSIVVDITGTSTVVGHVISIGTNTPSDSHTDQATAPLRSLGVRVT